VTLEHAMKATANLAVHVFEERPAKMPKVAEPAAKDWLSSPVIDCPEPGRLPSFLSTQLVVDV
jgi:hypothetical protein